MNFQDDEIQVKRKSFEKYNLIGIKDENRPFPFPILLPPDLPIPLPIPFSSSDDDHSWDDNIPRNGDLNPDQQRDHDELDG